VVQGGSGESFLRCGDNVLRQRHNYGAMEGVLRSYVHSVRGKWRVTLFQKTTIYEPSTSVEGGRRRRSCLLRHVSFCELGRGCRVGRRQENTWQKEQLHLVLAIGMRGWSAGTWGPYWCTECEMGGEGGNLMLWGWGGR